MPTAVSLPSPRLLPPGCFLLHQPQLTDACLDSLLHTSAGFMSCVHSLLTLGRRTWGQRGWEPGASSRCSVRVCGGTHRPQASVLHSGYAFLSKGTNLVTNTRLQKSSRSLWKTLRPQADNQISRRAAVGSHHTVLGHARLCVHTHANGAALERYSLLPLASSTLLCFLVSRDHFEKPEYYFLVWMSQFISEFPTTISEGLLLSAHEPCGEPLGGGQAELQVLERGNVRTQRPVF